MGRDRGWRGVIAKMKASTTRCAVASFFWGGGRCTGVLRRSKRGLVSGEKGKYVCRREERVWRNVQNDVCSLGEDVGSAAAVWSAGAMTTRSHYCTLAINNEQFIPAPVVESWNRYEAHHNDRTWVFQRKQVVKSEGGFNDTTTAGWTV